ncbi:MULTISPECIES: hypothetical protein [Brucella]|jgi:hypothetical protein|uniref:hypothetical protein n=1 Tax=Brucella TaxID=234 RepID=UPI00124D6840|nr:MULTISPECIES: hypothetical protein [Brucella]KAB2720560.1 hypothetical protein F9K73_11490 [Brucella intermedia]KAB2800617.1 hypothetical protein F9K87_03930 [Brucella anthropi]MCR5942879.1 hypothetical protein [Ochrobactrum sp. XJ1]
MYNTDLPNRADLPTSAQLKRSTFLAGLSAIAILVTVVLPSEYAIDPLGVGRVLGLTEMGEIKTQLAKEAADDAAAAQSDGETAEAANGEIKVISQRLDRIEMMIAASMDGTPAAEPQRTSSLPEQAKPAATDPAPTRERFGNVDSAETTAAVPSVPPVRTDEVSFTLSPGKGIEVKLVMEEGDKVDFAWTANGAVVNFDTHGDGNGNKVSYEKGRGVGEDSGVLEAAFTGNHGWFWRNRTDNDVTVTLKTNGEYSDLKQVM